MVIDNSNDNDNGINNLFEKLIPNHSELEIWSEKNFVESPFVEIPHIVKINSEIKIMVDMQYPKLGMKNAINRCLIRKEVFEKLAIACNYLPQNLAFKIWDTYRPWNLQNELYFVYKPDIIKQFNLEKLNEEEQERIISKYVSIPNKNEIIPPLHTTGGSIDLTITDLEKGEDLDFGIGFDDFSDLTHTNSYEKDNTNIVIRNNRRLLYNVMTLAGFTNLPSEVWHYDYGNRAWGYYNKKPAIYKGVLEVNDIDKIISFNEVMEELNSKELFNKIR